MRARYALKSFLVGAAVFSSLPGGSGRCETMSGALAKAYLTNPDLGQQRAATRAADEDVAKAKSGYRPKVTGSATLGYRSTDAENGKGRVVEDKTGPSFPQKVGIEGRETLFDGNRTATSVARSESEVLGAREKLRDKEQQTLLSAATAYMDVLRDTAVLGLRKNNVDVLIVRLREARARYAALEVTFTDVAEVASSLATARSGYFTAQGNLSRSIATYRRAIGVDPHRLDAARPVDGLLPATLASAIEIALAEHPRINDALHDVDVASLQVGLAESRLYPTVTAIARARQLVAQNGDPDRDLFEGGGRGEVAVPLYTGGADYAAVREAKERLSQAHLKVEAVREDVRAVVVTSWGQLNASKATIQSAEAAVKASQSAFIDVREEARIGQRTTLNMLEALQALLNARVTLVTAQRDRVVAGYTAMAATGRLCASCLDLAVPVYDPTVHFDQVKDKWIGLRTPDGP